MGNHKKAMVKFLKDGKIVVLLQGRYAGKKAVILKTMDDNTKERPYGHCVVVGVAKTPLPITRAMCKPTPKMKKLVKKRSTIKPFVIWSTSPTSCQPGTASRAPCQRLSRLPLLPTPSPRSLSRRSS